MKTHVLGALAESDTLFWSQGIVTNAFRQSTRISLVNVATLPAVLSHTSLGALLDGSGGSIALVDVELLGTAAGGGLITSTLGRAGRVFELACANIKGIAAPSRVSQYYKIEWCE